MAITQQALEFLQSLFLGDEAAVKEYNNDPAGSLERHGLASCSPVEINQAVAQLAPGLPGEAQARANAYLSSTQGVGGYTNGGPSQAAQGAEKVDAGKYGSPDPAPAAAVPPSLQAVSTEINYITQITQVDLDQVNNFTDNSVNQVIVAGGDVTQTFDQDTTNVTASGDGAVAAGADIQNSQVNTGTNTGIIADEADGAILGDGNTTIDSDGGDVTNVQGDGNVVGATNSVVGTGAGNVQGVAVDQGGSSSGSYSGTRGLGEGGGDVVTNFGDGGTAGNADVTQLDGGGFARGSSESSSGQDPAFGDDVNINIGQGTQTANETVDQSTDASVEETINTTTVANVGDDNDTTIAAEPESDPEPEPPADVDGP